MSDWRSSKLVVLLFSVVFSPGEYIRQLTHHGTISQLFNKFRYVLVLWPIFNSSEYQEQRNKTHHLIIHSTYIHQYPLVISKGEINDSCLLTYYGQLLDWLNLNYNLIVSHISDQIRIEHSPKINNNGWNCSFNVACNLNWWRRIWYVICSFLTETNLFCTLHEILLSP